MWWGYHFKLELKTRISFLYKILALVVIIVDEVIPGKKVSRDLAGSLCDQRDKFGATKSVQSAVKRGPKQRSCGWYELGTCVAGSSSCESIKFAGCTGVSDPSKGSTELKDGSQRSSSRIVEGQILSPPNKYPSMLQLRHKKKHLCGAVITKEQWALTSAQCVKGRDPDDLELVAGQPNLEDEPGTMQIFKLINFFIPTQYNNITQEHDFSLIKLQEKIISTEHVKVANLPELNAKPDYEAVFSVGWNTNVSEDGTGKMGHFLTEKEMMRVDDCNLYWDYWTSWSMICAAQEDYDGTGPCHSDMGGPLYAMVNGLQTLVGIASMGWGDDHHNGSCRYPDRPFKFTYVAHIVDAIKTQHHEQDTDNNLTQSASGTMFGFFDASGKFHDKI